MMNKLLFALLFFSAAAIAQEIPRTVIQGLVVSDSLEVENITIKNSTSKKSTVTDAKGNFSIAVHEKDTLAFSGVAFKSSVLIITKTHLAEELLKIRLSVKVTELEELIVRPYTLTGNLETDTKNLKVEVVDLHLGNMDFSVWPKFNNVDNALKSLTPGSGNDLNGINFAALGRLLFKPKPKIKRIEFVTEKNFVDAVKEKFSARFFKETLKIDESRIELFLNYCDANAIASRQLLNPKKEFELIEFLIKKSEEYLKINR